MPTSNRSSNAGTGWIVTSIGATRATSRAPAAQRPQPMIDEPAEVTTVFRRDEHERRPGERVEIGKASGRVAALRGDQHEIVGKQDVVYDVPGTNALSGRHQDPDAVMGYFGSLMALTGGSYRITDMLWLASGESVTLVTRNHAGADMRSLDWDEAIVFGFEGGRKKRSPCIRATRRRWTHFSEAWRQARPHGAPATPPLWPAPRRRRHRARPARCSPRRPPALRPPAPARLRSVTGPATPPAS